VSVIYNCCWPSTAHSFLGPSPMGLATIFYCLRFETSFCRLLRLLGLRWRYWTRFHTGNSLNSRMHSVLYLIGLPNRGHRVKQFTSPLSRKRPFRCCEKKLYLSVATEKLLPSRCLAMGAWNCLHYCGFQASCHNK
jgi:hypothetical protein